MRMTYTQAMWLYEKFVRMRGNFTNHAIEFHVGPSCDAMNRSDCPAHSYFLSKQHMTSCIGTMLRKGVSLKNVVVDWLVHGNTVRYVVGFKAIGVVGYALYGQADPVPCEYVVVVINFEWGGDSIRVISFYPTDDLSRIKGRSKIIRVT